MTGSFGSRVAIFTVIIIISIITLSAITQASEKSLAILPFTSLSRDENLDWLNNTLLSMLILDLSKAGKVEVIDQEEVRRIWEWMGLSELKIMDKRTAQQVGKKLAADLLVFGIYESADPYILLSFQLIDIESGKVIWQQGAQGEKGEITKLKDRLVEQILKGLELIKPESANRELEEVTVIEEEEEYTYEDAHALLTKSIEYTNRAIERYGEKGFPDNPLWKEAINYAERAVEADPDYTEAHYHLATLYYRTRWYVKLIEECERVMELDPYGDYGQDTRAMVAEGYFELGYGLYTARRTEEAIDRFKKAIWMDNNSLKAHYWLARIYKETNNLRKSIEEWEEVLRIDPHNSEAKWFLERTKDEAQYGVDAYNHYLRGYDLYSKGLLESAIEELRMAVELNPDFAKAHDWLGRAYKKTGYIEGYADYQGRFLDLNPDKQEASAGHHNLGYELYTLGKFDLAIQEFERAYELDPHNIDSLYWLGRTYYDIGELDSAIPILSAVLEIQPDHKGAKYLLDRAEQMLNK